MEPHLRGGWGRGYQTGEDLRCTCTSTAVPDINTRGVGRIRDSFANTTCVIIKLSQGKDPPLTKIPLTIMISFAIILEQSRFIFSSMSVLFL